MAFDPDEEAVIFEIIDLPQDGQTIVTTSLVHAPLSNVEIWEPTFNKGNLSKLVSVIKEKIKKCGSGQQTRVRLLLTRWDVIGSTSVLNLTNAANGASGQIVNHAEERSNIRVRLGNILGISVPPGGFLTEIANTYGQSLAIPVSRGNSNNIGDR